MKISDEKRRSYKRYAWGVLFMELILTFAALLGVEFWKMDIQAIDINSNLQAQAQAIALTGLMALITTLINIILSRSMEMLSMMEKHQTQTRRLESLILKTIITQTINTVFIYGTVYFVRPSVNILNTHGLTYQITSLVIVSGIVALIIDIFQPIQRLKVCIRDYKVDKSKPVQKFQIQLNRRFALPEFDFNEKYSFYVIFFFLVSFYGFLVPEVTIMCIIFYFLLYWIDKYNLLRRYSAPGDISHTLTELMLRILEASVVFFALGNLLWDLAVHYDSTAGYRVFNIISLIIAGSYVLVSNLANRFFTKTILRNTYKLDVRAYTYLFSNKGKQSKTFFS
jgi:hypothetical protein